MSIPENVFESGLNIAHLAPIIVNSGACVGKDVQIFPCVGIVSGRKASKTNPDAPIIGDGCALSMGCVITGSVVLADNIVVGANAVVNKSFFGI